MARIVTGAGSVTVLPLLHTWPDRYGVLAYTTIGAFGDTAVVGYVPIVDIPDMPLMDIAARHRPTRVYGSAGGAGFAEACWLVCTGWSGRVVGKPGTIELPDAEWSLEVDETTQLFKTAYGHDRLHVGRITLTDPELLAQARSVLPVAARAAAAVGTNAAAAERSPRRTPRTSMPLGTVAVNMVIEATVDDEDDDEFDGTDIEDEVKLRVVRDSKDPAGPVLTLTPTAWADFVAYAGGGDAR